MTTDDKIKLVQLLGEYLTEKAKENRASKTVVVPTKALYTHARILHTKLSVEIESELNSIWEA